MLILKIKHIKMKWVIKLRIQSPSFYDFRHIQHITPIYTIMIQCYCIYSVSNLTAELHLSLSNIYRTFKKQTLPFHMEYI